MDLQAEKGLRRAFWGQFMSLIIDTAGVREAWVQIPAPPLSRWVNVGRALLWPWFPI